MTKKKIAKAYIEAAEKCISEGKKDRYEKFIKRLMTEKLDEGVCHFINSKLLINLLINKKAKYLYKQEYFDDTSVMYWTRPPYFTETKKQAVKALQYRINILKTWL
jgi:hypothetical protein